MAGRPRSRQQTKEGWVVSVTPSGGWNPGGHRGENRRPIEPERHRSFVTDAADGPYNVIEPGKHPRVTLTPTLALKDGRPYLCFSVQGGDSQDQNLLQFFLNFVEFGMNVQRATEAPNINSFQMRSSFGMHEIRPGRILLANSTPQNVRDELIKMGYTLTFEGIGPRGSINAIFLDQSHKTIWGGSSNHGDDYGIAVVVPQINSTSMLRVRFLSERPQLLIRCLLVCQIRSRRAAAKTSWVTVRCRRAFDRW